MSGKTGRNRDQCDSCIGSFQEFCFARLGKALKDMASAQKIDLDRELKIRQETATEAATAAGKVAGEKGLTADTIDAIKEAVLGVSRP